MSISETLREAPPLPGVYQYFDRSGRLLYIGKAKNLKYRLKSYWRLTPYLRPNPDTTPRILRMLEEAERLEYILVDSEEDALILENSLIKQLKPKYNILLRDDKTYPYIFIDEGELFPRFEITRKVVQGKKVRYYGPFPSGARALLDTLYEVYPLVQKKGCQNRKEACLFYQIGRCPAPCEGKVTPEDYMNTVEEARSAMHNLKKLVSKLEERMNILADQERFEEASRIRDRIAAIQQLKISSDIDLASNEHYDIFAVVNGESRGVVLRLFMRHGKIAASSHSFFRQTEMFDCEEAYRQALISFYDKNTPDSVSTILVAHELKGADELGATLTLRRGRKSAVVYPRRGRKTKLVELALKNARELLRIENKKSTGIEKKIRDLFGLDLIPWRVEVFDNSHMMGEAPVGAMVVWSDGEWMKTSYRRYSLTARDEYHQMEEMLRRRIREFRTDPPPDMWLLDGGDTLLMLAEDLLSEAGVDLPVVAIAKEKIDAKAHRAKGAARDILYFGKGEAIHLDPADKRLQWLQRLRDEAHRFALAYHRSKKRSLDRRISLLEHRGIGPATVKKLLDYFGTFDAVEKASREELVAVAGEKVAKILSEKR